MRATTLWVSMLLLAGCPGVLTTDAGEEPEPEPPFEGVTTSNVLPDLPIGEPQQVDGGPFEVDLRCCHLAFSIDDLEPAAATGFVRGNVGALSGDGLPLIRDGGSWFAAACMPLGASTTYVYEFSWPDLDAGTPDAGEADGGDEDAGLIYEMSRRASQTETRFGDGLGGETNYLPQTSSCEALDASVGMLP